MKIHELSISDLTIIKSRLESERTKVWYKNNQEEDEKYQEITLLIEKVEKEIERRIELLK